MFDCSKDVRAYHDQNVTLLKTDQDAMRDRRDANRRRLRKGLDANGDPAPSEFVKQGSYAMRTMVQHPDNDYDIDDGVYFDEAVLVDQYGFALTPLEAKERVCTALSRDKRFANSAEVFPKCVRQAYHQGYHIDMPVYRIRKEDNGWGGTREVFELAGDGSWDPSDARATTRWFKQQVADRNGESEGHGDQMRRVIRLTKSYARSRSDWKDETTSGIVITKLVSDHFVGFDGRDDEALLETWKAIKAQLDWSTEVAHPVNASKLAEAGNAKVRFFRDKLGWAIQQLTVLEDDCTRSEAREAWDQVYASSYFQALPEPVQKAEASRGFFIATEARSDVRNDGNGRFG